MEIDWGGKFNYTSCGHPMANWQGHETHPTGHKTSEVDWGGHDPNGSDNPPPMSIINLDDLLGRTFLLPMDEKRERKRAVNPNRDSPNGYPTVTPTELQPVTLAH